MFKTLKSNIIALCSGMVLQLAVIALGTLVVSTEVHAQAISTCTGGYWICATNGSNGWIRPSTTTSTAYIDIKDFNFPQTSAAYPIYSNNTVTRSLDKQLAVTNQIASKGATSGITVRITPTNNLTYNSTYNAFSVRGAPSNLLFQFSLTLSGGTSGTVTAGQNGGSINLVIPSRGSKPSLSTVSVNIKAIVIGDVGTTTITLPANTKIFEVYHSAISSPLGEFYISGSSTINPPPPPAPKTCDALPANYERVFNLSTINVDTLQAGQESSVSATQNVTLSNCPVGINVRMAVSDAAFPNNTNDYLRNQVGTDYAANAGIRLYYNGNEKITMTSWNKTVQTTAATMNLPFTAKYYHTGGSLGIGRVLSTATVTISYP